MKELLSPAGNMECLKAAVNNGADAIYLGGKTFGARAYAGNFSNEELKEAVNYAHLYGVKIYITVNTIIYNTEVDELIKYIEYLYKIGRIKTDKKTVEMLENSVKQDVPYISDYF